MSQSLLVTLTVVQVVALVAVLAGYLIVLTQRLRSISLSLSKIAWGVRAVEVEVGSIGPNVTEVNRLLTELTEDLLPEVAAMATERAG